MKQCKVSDCTKKIKTRGLCSMHYERLRVYGDVNFKKSLIIDISGHRFGRLTAKRIVSNVGEPTEWLCVCDCGVSTNVRVGNLRNGHTQSCGCFASESKAKIHSTHGLSKTGTYRSWIAMRRRCRDETYIEWHLYGGRGIGVCEAWNNSFETFLSDMGLRPSRSHSIDRIDPDGNYEPSNCRWATPKQQANNKRKRSNVSR